MNPANNDSPPEGENSHATADADTAPDPRNQADSQDTHQGLAGEDRYRAILRGEIPADSADKGNDHGVQERHRLVAPEVTPGRGLKLGLFPPMSTSLSLCVRTSGVPAESRKP